MRNKMIALAVAALSVSAFAQDVVVQPLQAEGIVIQSQCTKVQAESLVGAGVGAAAGAAATKVALNLFGVRGKISEAATLAGAAAGGALGNSMAAEVKYNCSAVIRSGNDQHLYVGTTEKEVLVGDKASVMKMANGTNHVTIGAK